MKLIKCVVRDEKVVRGHGTHGTRTEFYRGIAYAARLLPKSMIDVVAPDDLVDDVIRVVTETASTGEASDGRIFVMTVDEAYTIRTRQGGVA